MSSFTMDHKYDREQEQPGNSNIAILWGFVNKTIIPLALVGYEIVWPAWCYVAPRLTTISYPRALME